jgi:hypothetical protein
MVNDPGSRREKKPTSWRSFFFDDLGSNKNIIEDLHKPKGKRARTFTGFIRVSDAGIPGKNRKKQNLIRMLLVLFFAFDLFLVIYLLAILK